MRMKSLKRSSVFGMCLILSVMGAGCWTKTDAPERNTETESASAPIVIDDRYNGCLLLTKADAEAVLGASVLEPLYNAAMSEDGLTIVSSCNYATAGESENEVKVVSLLARKAASSDEALRVYEETRAQSSAISGAEPEDVEGLGDRAYWAGGSLTQMNVLKGEVWLIVNVRDMQSNDLRTQATEAARRAVANTR